MATLSIPQDTRFTFDLVGRYGCNTLDEALDSKDTGKHADARPFDFIILGGGSFAAVLAARLFNRDKSHAHRILVLEGGPFVLPEHVQNLPESFGAPGKNTPGTVWGQPWISDSQQTFNQDFPGLAYCLGGRSVFWGGWSPYLIDSELDDAIWPASVKTDLTTKVTPRNNPVESYFEGAARQIGTDTTNDFLFGPLHTAMRKQLFTGLKKRAPGGKADVLTGNRGALNLNERNRTKQGAELEAPLAVQSASSRPGTFSTNKFNGVQLLLRAARSAQSEAEGAAKGGAAVSDVKKRLMVVDNCYVTRLERIGRRITRVFVREAEYACAGGALNRTMGPERAIEAPESGKVFLALGTIENTRLALLTVPEKNLIGRNLMAHLRSNLTFRIPRSAFGDTLNPDKQPTEELKRLVRELQVSALFVKGIHTHKDGSKGHYHFQITASGVGELSKNSEAELFKKIPNIDDLDQFKDLTDKWVVVTVRGIGEMVGDKTSADPQNRVTLDAPDGNGVPRAKVRLETNWKDPTDPRATNKTNPKASKENELWDAMDNSALEVAAMFAAGGPIQYLSIPNDPANAHWLSEPPSKTAGKFDMYRDTLSSTHHEGGTLWMGEKPETSVTDPFGRIWELDNLHAVGPALLPTLGSPNPMLSGVALTRRMADNLLPDPVVTPLENNFEYLFDGTEKTFQRWLAAGPGAFALVDGLIIAQPSGDHTVLFYAAEAFNDFILRLQFRVNGPLDPFGKSFDNSGVFLRFRYPHKKWPDLDRRAANNPAWVAALTGFEVQIDDRGSPAYYDKNRTGAIYDIPSGQFINGVQEPQEQTFQAGPVLQPGKWYDYEIEVIGDKYKVRLKEESAANYTQTATFDKAAASAKYSSRGLPASANGTSGYIGVQAHTGKVAFRRIRIRKK